MARAFDFDDSVKRNAFRRQQGLCACCGEDLADLYDNAHHVVPNQRGRARNPGDAWIAGGDNCVVLCDTCHPRVHADGHFRDGATAPPDYFRFSHGKRAGEHRHWVERMNRLYWS